MYGRIRVKFLKRSWQVVGVGVMFRAPGAVACSEGVAEAKNPQSFGYWRRHFVCCVSWKRGNGQKFCPSEEGLKANLFEVTHFLCHLRRSPDSVSHSLILKRSSAHRLYRYDRTPTKRCSFPKLRTQRPDGYNRPPTTVLRT